MTQLVATLVIAVVTAAFVNTLVSIARRHEYAGHAITMRDVLDDACNVSMRVRDYVEQLGGGH